MRTIKFRAISEQTGNYVYGSLFNAASGISIIENGGSNAVDFHFVNPESVGQFTGLHDKNGKEIYEGDILVKVEIDYDKWNDVDFEGETPMKRDKKDIATMDRFPCYWLQNEDFGYEGEDLEHSENWEVIGNVHESPELLNQN